MIKNYFYKNFKSLIKSKIKYIILYFMILFFFIIFQKNLNHMQVDKVYLESLGLRISSDLNLLSVLIIIYHLAIISYINFYLITTELKNNISNIFLRTSINTWYTTKTISISIITIIFKAITHIVINIFFLCFYSNFKISIILFFKYLLYSLIFSISFQQITTFIYIIKNNYIKIIFLLTSILLLTLINTHHFNILIFLFISVLFYSLNKVYFKKNYYYIFEKEKK